MATINIDGFAKAVTVDDSFLSLTPGQQAETVEQIARSLGVRKESVGDVATGVARSLIGQGFALGFGDEIEAFVRSKVNGTSFDDEVESVRKELEEFGEAHPVLSTGAEIIGAMALPVGGILKGATVAARAARGSAVGAATGAAFGAGTAEGGLEDRAKGAATGAAFGAVGGAAAPVAIEGAIRGGRAAVNALSKAGAPIRGAVNPKQEAATRVAEAIQSDNRLGQGLPKALASGAQRAGVPVANIDRGGETTQRLARSAINTSPEGGAKINQFIDSRFEGQGERITSAIDGLFGGKRKSAFQRREALQVAAEKERSPLYRKAYEDGDRAIVTDELRRLISTSKTLGTAMKAAEDKGMDAAAIRGFGGFNTKIDVTNDGLVKFGRGKSGQPTFPNLAFWDATKKQLDQAARVAARSGANEDAAVFQELSRQLRKELDKAVPSYAKARSKAAEFFGAGDALEAGQKFATSRRIKPEEAAAQIKGMTKAERELFAEGFADELITKVSQTGERRNVVQSIYNSPDARLRIRTALGDKRANELEARMRLEGLMDLARRAQGNSTTARQLVELGFAGSAGGFAGFTSGGDPLTIGLSALAGKAGGRIANRSRDAIGREVSKLLTSGDLNAVDSAAKKVAARAGLLSSLRSLDARLSRALGTQSAGGGNQTLSK